MKIEGDKVWLNADLPVDVRAPEQFLFAFKKLMASKEWGYSLENLWIDKVQKTIKLGRELILSVVLENSKMKITFGAFWEEHIQGDADFKKLAKDAQDQLDRPSKGDGKGNKGKAGKIPASHS